VGPAGAEGNWRVAGERHRFDEVEQQTRDKWRKALSVIGVEDEKEEDKTIFYTALYHSFLFPWIISDADGRYRGQDGAIHQASGKLEYGGFSPWDSFRSQQPLLTLLMPERERDIILSMLDVYRQTGHLPSGPMTGNHSVPIIADAWCKGIRGFDPEQAYEAMRKGIVEAPYLPADREVYRRLGYLPLTYPESVTRTVEYAYDDWALSRFAVDALHRDVNADGLSQGSYSYRNVFDADQLFFLPREAGALPREGGRFQRRPGTSGYKEGDQWVYTYFVPQHPEDLVNLLGGGRAFAGRLDKALRDGEIVFDNETVFHIPYLFNYAGLPGKTGEWVSALRDGRFAPTPGGLPGNDDLGAFSSWFVFSAMGFFPVCPGRPEYAIGTPLFSSLTLHLAEGRKFVIHAPGAGGSNRYVRSLTVDGNRYDRLALSDSLVRKGGEAVFEMSDAPDDGWVRPLAGDAPVFSFAGLTVSKGRVAPNETLQARFTIRNTGSPGTAIVVLKVNGQEYARKNCLVGAGGLLVDSIACRLYPVGRNVLSVAGMEQEVEVMGRGVAEPEITGLVVRPLLRVGDRQSVSYLVQNIDGVAHQYVIPVYEGDERSISTDTLLLQPGEKKRVVVDWMVRQAGLKEVRVKTVKGVFKVYTEATGSLLLSLSLGDGLLTDSSGFGNVVRRMGSPEDGYVEVENSASLDQMGETITMAARVYPTERGEELMDILTKGDNHVLQVKDNKQLSFFAGGWGRGDCTVDLPAGWVGHWHHIAGVCTGDGLRVYIDGKLAGSSKLTDRVNLSVTNKWTLGRNEEFPGQRIFKGRLADVRVWSEPLSDGEISVLARGR
jgi:hypothetical protein